MAKKKISNIVFDKSETKDAGQTAKDERQIFYRLASPFSASVEGHVGKVSLFLVFAVIWTVGLVGITVANLVTGEKFETVAIILICIFAAVAAGFLAFGIIDQKRQLSANAEERALLNDCLCTDGKITKCNCVERRTQSDSRSYDITLVYEYKDLSRKTVTGVHNATYGYDPEFYVGQYLMIAFNGKGSSRILKNFTLKKEDERAFLKNEAARSEDDFDGLNGKTLKYDTDKIKSAELPWVWFWAAFALFIFVAAYTVPMSVLAVPQLVTGHAVPDVFIIFIIYLMPAILTAVIIYFLSNFFKGNNKIKNILKNEPKFTRGKIFASEKTYRGGLKKVVFCYIDDKGGKITEELKTPYYRKTVRGNARFVTVVYDKSGRSVPIE